MWFIKRMFRASSQFGYHACYESNSNKVVPKPIVESFLRFLIPYSLFLLYQFNLDFILPICASFHSFVSSNLGIHSKVIYCFLSRLHFFSVCGVDSKFSLSVHPFLYGTGWKMAEAGGKRTSKSSQLRIICEKLFTIL